MTDPFQEAALFYMGPVEVVQAKTGDNSYQKGTRRPDLGFNGSLPSDEGLLENILSVRSVTQHAPGNAEQ